MYKILLDKQVVKFLEKSSQDIFDRIKKKLKLLKEKPFYYLEHFECESYYKLRIGNYRALIDIDFENKILYVRVLEHRRKIYKK
jgi:mRNA interferase RelE/StbE